MLGVFQGFSHPPPPVLGNLLKSFGKFYVSKICVTDPRQYHKSALLRTYGSKHLEEYTNKCQTILKCTTGSRIVAVQTSPLCLSSSENFLLHCTVPLVLPSPFPSLFSPVSSHSVCWSVFTTKDCKILNRNLPPQLALCGMTRSHHFD